MGALTFLGILCFYIHYYVVLALIAFVNVFKYLWKFFTQTSSDKHHISPYEAVHKDVFSHLCTFFSMQMTLFRTKVSPSKPLLFKLQTRFQLRCGEFTKKIPLPPNPTLSYSCMDFWTALSPGSSK
jgi:hypothetical protein